jgi:hypothetical protein
VEARCVEDVDTVVRQDATEIHGQVADQPEAVT